MTYEETIDHLSLYPWGICMGEPHGEEPYRSGKKRKSDDLLWKGVVEDFFDDFLRFFYPDHVQDFDLDKGVTFLNNELGQLFPPDEDQYAPRRVDKLARIFTSGGKEECILVHIEVVRLVSRLFNCFTPPKGGTAKPVFL